MGHPDSHAPQLLSGQMPHRIHILRLSQVCALASMPGLNWGTVQVHGTPPVKLKCVLIPMKVTTDSDLIPVTCSDAIPITVGAKRRWRAYGA
jgi:hypothetical protein